MNYDNTFPHYANKIITCLVGFLIVGAVICQWKWGWQVSCGFALATGLHLAFFCFLKFRYSHWVKEGKEPVYIGRRMAGLAMSRFILEIILAVVVVLYTPLNVFGFLAGLLTLAVATFAERVVEVIKR